MGKSKYISIMGSIFEWKCPGQDEIVEYYSNKGNNDVTYPICIGKKNVYSVISMEYIPISELPKKKIQKHF
jgi:hypothetical protein